VTRDTRAAGSPAPRAGLFSFYCKAWCVSSTNTPGTGCPSACSALLVAPRDPVGLQPRCVSKLKLVSRKEMSWFSASSCPYCFLWRTWRCAEVPLGFSSAVPCQELGVRMQGGLCARTAPAISKA